MAMDRTDTGIGATLGVVLGEPATYDAAGYAALTYTDVGEVVDAGSPERSFDDITYNTIGSDETTHIKSYLNNGDVALVLGRKSTNTGQVTLEAGFNGANKNSIHSFKLALPNGDIIYYAGQIFSFGTTFGTGNNVIMRNINIKPNNIVEA